MLRLSVPFGVVLASAMGVALNAQQSSAPSSYPVRHIGQYSSTVQAKGKQVRVAIDSWTIVNRQKIEALDLPLKGTTLVEVRTGSLLTTINGRQEKRRAGDFWIVPAGTKMALETENDTASIQTTVIAE